MEWSASLGLMEMEAPRGIDNDVLLMQLVQPETQAMPIPRLGLGLEAKDYTCTGNLAEYAQQGSSTTDDSGSDVNSSLSSGATQESANNGGMGLHFQPGTMLLVEVQLAVLRAEEKIAEMSPEPGSILSITGETDNAFLKEHRLNHPTKERQNRRRRKSLIDKAELLQRRTAVKDEVKDVQHAAKDLQQQGAKEEGFLNQLAKFVSSRENENACDTADTTVIHTEVPVASPEPKEAKKAVQMACNSCGHTFPVGWAFCRYCGVPLEKQ